MDRFEIKSEAGTGGMGTVYQAIDRRTGMVVALKVLHVRTALKVRVLIRRRTSWRNCYIRASSAIRSRTAPMDRPSSPWSARGETLEIACRALSGPAAVAHVAYRVLDALAAAHERGVVHRDINQATSFWWAGGSPTRASSISASPAACSPKRSRTRARPWEPLYASPSRLAPSRRGCRPISSLSMCVVRGADGEPPFTGTMPRGDAEGVRGHSGTAVVAPIERAA